MLLIIYSSVCSLCCRVSCFSHSPVISDFERISSHSRAHSVFKHADVYVAYSCSLYSVVFFLDSPRSVVKKKKDDKRFGRFISVRCEIDKFILSFVDDDEEGAQNVFCKHKYTSFIRKFTFYSGRLRKILTVPDSSNSICDPFIFDSIFALHAIRCDIEAETLFFWLSFFFVHSFIVHCWCMHVFESEYFLSRNDCVIRLWVCSNKRKKKKLLYVYLLYVCIFGVCQNERDSIYEPETGTQYASATCFLIILPHNHLTHATNAWHDKEKKKKSSLSLSVCHTVIVDTCDNTSGYIDIGKRIEFYCL